MKKIGVCILVFVLIFSWVSPAMAQSSSREVGRDIKISAPATAYSGDDIEVSITVSSQTKVKNSLVVIFPKTSVVYVFGPGNIPIEQTSDSWIYRWNYRLGKNESITLSFRMKLVDKLGTLSLVKVIERKKLIASQSIELISRPPQPLDISISTPKTVVSGGRPFSVFITVANPNPSTEMSFDVSIQVLFPATNKSVYPIVRGGDTYNAIGDGNSYTLFWRGTVPARSNFQINLGLASGNIGGTYDLISMTDLLGSKVWKSAITVVAPVDPPHGELRLEPSIVRAGDLVMLEGEFFASEPSQFVMKGYESTCPIEGLPSGQVSPANLTYLYTTHYVTILSMSPTSDVSSSETPTPSLMVKCNLTVDFYLWNDPETVFTAYGSYQMMVP